MSDSHSTPAQQVHEVPYAALRAWRRELFQTFFSTVWKPSPSLGSSSLAGGGTTGEAGLTGVASPAPACDLAASRARHPPPPPPSAPGRYLPATGAGLSDLGGVSMPVRPEGTPDRRQVFVSSRTGARVGATGACGAALRSASLRIAASSRSACRRAASIACWRSSSLCLRMLARRSSSSRFFCSSAA